MANLNPAEQSPRIEEGILKWYEGDTFTMTVSITIKDQDGTTINIGEDDDVVFEFKNEKKKDLFNLTISGADIEYNKVKFFLSEEYTNKMKVGTYYYDIGYVHDDCKTTISRSNKAMVE